MGEDIPPAIVYNISVIDIILAQSKGKQGVAACEVRLNIHHHPLTTTTQILDQLPLGSRRLRTEHISGIVLLNHHHYSSGPVKIVVAGPLQFALDVPGRSTLMRTPTAASPRTHYDFLVSSTAKPCSARGHSSASASVLENRRQKDADGGCLVRLNLQAAETAVEGYGSGYDNGFIIE